MNRVTGSTKRRLLWFLAVVVAAAVVVSCQAVRQQRAFEQRTHCVGNLVHIRMAKASCQKDLGLADGAPISEKTLNKYLSELGSGPLSAYRCPNSGTYLIGNVGTLPKCTYTKVSYTWQLGKSPPWLKRRAWKHSLEP